MATIKTYTDLEQSKKLAKILPLESADMYYCALIKGMRDKMTITGWEVNVGLDIAIKENLFSHREGYMFPCWSLAALLKVMREAIGYTLYGLSNIRIICELGDRPWSYTTKVYDNEVDACVEMIEKLHELDLL